MSGAEERPIEDVANAFRQASIYLAGIAAGIDIAAQMVTPAADPAETSERSHAPRARRRAVQRLVLDIMRRLKEPMTVEDLIAIAKSHGADPRRDTVRKILQRLVQRGLATQRGPRYQLVADSMETDEVAAELEELVPRNLLTDSDNQTGG